MTGSDTRDSADVVVNYVTGEDSAEAVVAEIRRSGVRAYSHCADVSSEDQVKEMFSRMVAELGTIDILVNFVDGGMTLYPGFTENG